MTAYLRWTRCRALLLSTPLGLLPACAPPVADAPLVASPIAPAPVVRFRYPSLDGQGAIDDEQLRGRVTVIAFITTYDLASQAQVRFVTGLVKRHTPRINAAAIVLEPSANAPLVSAFANALRLPYPLGWADDATISGHGPFGDVHAVPTTVVLDKRGKLSWKHVGLAKEDEIESAINGL